jgi:phosphate transport system substrate-binding protein
MNNASRPILPDEIQRAEKNNIEFIELPVAYDGLAVVAHPENDWANCLTTEELEMIWEPNSSVETWSDIRSEWPDESLSLYGPGTASGTYDYFTEAIMGESGASRTDFTASEDDNVLVQGVSGDEYSLGFFGLAYYENNEDRLKIVGVDDENPDNGEGCINPSRETVQNGTYQPLARPLFVYVNANEAENPAVAAYVDYYLENVGGLVDEVGYIALSQEAYKLARDRFNNRITGTMLGECTDPVGIDVEQLLRESQPPSPQESPAE